MDKQTITALYDNREYANNAALMLRQAGVPDSDITLSPEGAATSSEHPGGKGFWASLEDMFGGTDDHATYAEGVRRGGILLTATVNATQVDDAVVILEKHGSVDFDEREASWRNEGWTGTATTGMMDRPDETTAGVLGVASTGAPLGVQRQPVTASPAQTRGTADDVIQIVEERLDIGKRAVSRGKVRLHTSVISTPVSESVSLRDETVTIDRRPVDRPLGAAAVGVDAFQDRTIEMDEIDEEAVVAKTAHVVEEIGIRKDVTDRTQTITDTVRSTKVDIEDGRTVSGAKTGLMGSAASNLAPDMEVVGSDGQHVGVIDHVDGGSIKLKKMDSAAGGQHHLIPTSWVASTEGKVKLTMTAAEAKSRWTAAG